MSNFLKTYGKMIVVVLSMVSAGLVGKGYVDAKDAEVIKAAVSAAVVEAAKDDVTTVTVGR